MPLIFEQQQKQQQKQALQLSPQALLGLRMLTKSLPELRTEIAAEMSRNPAIEDVEQTLESPLSEVEHASDEAADVPDYPEDDEEAPSLGRDEDLAERRQAFFDNQVKTETLQEHLIAQLPLSDIDPNDWQLAESIIGELDDDGYFRGSLPDFCQVFGREEEKIRAVMDRVTQLDPPGCGARDVRGCLLAQVDAIEEGALREKVRQLIDRHLEDVAAGRVAEIEKALGLDADGYQRVLKALRTLDGRPGRQFQSVRDRVEYVNPEIRAVKRAGRWVATMDARSLPEIRLSKKFAELLTDPKQTAETKAYVRERMAAAEALREAIVRRQQTIQNIADAIFARQQDFFEAGFSALKPMTEGEIAAQVGVHAATVSRTVRDKYAATPKGTIELRRFFTKGVKTGSGEELSQQAVLDALKVLVESEDKSAPLSDEKLAAALKAKGYPVARRTVAKYRDRLAIPGALERRGSGG